MTKVAWLSDSGSELALFDRSTRVEGVPARRSTEASMSGVMARSSIGQRMWGAWAVWMASSVVVELAILSPTMAFSELFPIKCVNY